MKAHQAESGQSKKSGASSLPWLGIYLAAAAPYSLLVWRFWFVCDDAFISLRFARNWVQGYGLRFNPGEGEPVEGFSNFLWTALLAVLEGLDLEAFRIAPWIGFLLGLVLLGLLLRLLKDDLGAPRWAALLGLLAAALSPAFAVWTTGGLETMLFTLLLFLSFKYLLIQKEESKPLRAGLFAGLMALTRPEGMIWALALGFLLLLFRPSEQDLRKTFRSFFLFLGAALLLFAPYLVFRWLYYGFPLPNTAYAKAAVSWFTLERGLSYTLVNLLEPVAPALLALCIPFCLSRKAAARPVMLASLCCLGMLAFSVLSGGDFMAMGRFIAPAMPFFAILATRMGMRFQDFAGRKGVFSLLAAFLVMLSPLLSTFDLAPLPDAVRRQLHFRWNAEEVRTEWEQWYFMDRNARRWSWLGRAVKACTEPGDSCVSAAIGALGYYSERVIYDQCGLVDLEVSRRREAETTKRSPGHDKFVDAEFFLERKPDILRADIVSKKFKAERVSQYEQTLPPGYRVETASLAKLLGEGRFRGMVLVMQRR
ncbi:MAG: hypothetical protein ACYTG7_12635 [Planctomycetota bacterium]